MNILSIKSYANEIEFLFEIYLELSDNLNERAHMMIAFDLFKVDLRNRKNVKRSSDSSPKISQFHKRLYWFVY